MNTRSQPRINPFVLLVAVVVVFWWTGLGGTILGSWSNHADKIRAEQKRAESIEQDARADSASTLCPDYFAASWWDRNWGGYSRFSWCEDFRDRI